MPPNLIAANPLKWFIEYYVIITSIYIAIRDTTPCPSIHLQETGGVKIPSWTGRVYRIIIIIRVLYSLFVIYFLSLLQTIYIYEI